MGADKTNFTGSVIYNSDVKVSSFRYWQSYLEDEEIKQHAFDHESYGLLHPYDSDSVTMFDNLHVPKIETLAINWNFNLNTGSNSAGAFEVIDLSSGSAEMASRYGWVGELTQNKHYGTGHGFITNSTASIDKIYINTAKRKQVNSIYSSDMITIKSGSTEFFFQDDEVSDNFYSFEKSMQSVISDEMIKMFASIKDFNNLIGEPANKYRQSYKEMDHLKRIFFEGIENDPDQQKFFEFYKWIDSSVSHAIRQLYPASTRFSKGILNVVESHVLERNKYQSKFPLVSKKSSTEGGIRGTKRSCHIIGNLVTHQTIKRQMRTNTICWLKIQKRKRNR